MPIPRCAPTAGADKHRLRPALELIEADVARPLSLDALAAAVGLGRFHFLRLFKASLGCPPHHYLVQRRVARAKALLEDGVSPAQAGVAAGFFDQSHFANAFRRTYGMTPRGYQRGSWTGNRARKITASRFAVCHLVGRTSP